MRILVCIFKYYGDVLLTSPIYTTLRMEFPLAKIDVYLFKNTKVMLDGHPDIDEFITFDRNSKKFLYELRMLMNVRRRKYDIVINMTSGDRGAIIALLSGARIRVGIEPDKRGVFGKTKFFTNLIKNTNERRHIVEKNYDTLRSIGIFQKENDTMELFFHVPDVELEKIKKIVPYDNFIVIHPFSRCSYKNWPIEKFVSLINYLKYKGENVVISGGIEGKKHVFDGALNLSGMTTVKELGALIKLSKMLITVDSMPVHIASALKQKVLVICGPSDDIKWGPWKNPNGDVVRLDIPCKRCDNEGCGGTWRSRCLYNLPVENVISSLCKILTMPLNCEILTKI